MRQTGMRTARRKKKELSHEYKKANASVIVIAGTALVTVLFITALGLLSRFGI